MATYIGVIHKDPRSDYGISFPDFPGCISAGSTLDEVRRMGAEALAFHVEGMLADGEPIPEPSPLEAVMRDPDFRDGVAVLIDVPDAPAQAVRINITVPAADLKAIDGFAERHGMSRSGLLVRAARSLMRGDDGRIAAGATGKGAARDRARAAATSGALRAIRDGREARARSKKKA